jgi:hypothetical protein
MRISFRQDLLMPTQPLIAVRPFPPIEQWEILYAGRRSTIIVNAGLTKHDRRAL